MTVKNLNSQEFNAFLNKIRKGEYLEVSDFLSMRRYASGQMEKSQLQNALISGYQALQERIVELQALLRQGKSDGPR